MLDALSDALARQIFETLAADRSHARADLDRLPPLAAHALRQRLDREAGTRLDEAAPWLSRTPEAWREEAMEGARFPDGAWQPAVRETCHTLLATLVMPSEVLPEQLIPGEAAPVADVLGGLKSLGVYPYLSEIVRRYAEKKGTETFEREELGHLIARIDRRVAAELDVDGWMALLTPLYDLVGGIPEQSGDVPGRVLAEAFSARGCPGLGREVVSKVEVSADTLRGILAQSLAPEAAGDAPLAPATAAAVTEQAPAEVHSVAEIPHDEAEDIEDADIVDEAPEAEATAGEAPTDDGGAPLAPEAASSASDFLAALIESDGMDVDGSAAEEKGSGEADYTVGRIVTAPDEVPQDEKSDESAAEIDVPSDKESRSTEAPEPRTSPFDAPIQPLLDETASEADAPTEPADAAESEASGEAASGEESANQEPSHSDATPEAEPEHETLLDRLARQRGHTLGTGAPPSTDAPPTPEPASGDPIWKRFAHGEAPEAASPAPTLYDAMRGPRPDAPLEEHEAAVLGDAAENRDWYTENLFSGDGDAYARVLAQLSASSSWTAATQIIGREVFRRHKVNIYSEPAVSFTEAVEARLRHD